MFLYRMPAFLGLALVLVGGGFVLGAYVHGGFALGGWLTGALLLAWSFVAAGIARSGRTAG